MSNCITFNDEYMVDSTMDAARDQAKGERTPDSAARKMPDADHKELQVYNTAITMQLERRMERVEKLLIWLFAASVLNAIAILLSR